MQMINFHDGLIGSVDWPRYSMLMIAGDQLQIANDTHFSY